MKHNISNIALRAALIYGLFGALWIAVSDNIVSALFNDINIIQTISIYKGWAFVGITALLLYYALRAQLYRWSIESKRRQFVESELAEKEIQYKLITENVSDVIWVLDLTTSNFLYVSPSVEKLRGFTVNEVLSQTMAEAISPVSQNFLAAVIPERLAEFSNGISKSYTDEIEQPHKDGRTIITETTTRFVKNKKTGHYEVYGASRDIFERKQAEQILQKSEQRFHSAFDSMLEGAQILGFDWSYLYINAAAELHNQRPSNELLGKRYMDMWPGIESTTVFFEIKRCMNERIVKQIENEFIFPSGVAGWFNLSIQPVPEGVLILSFDITERKRAEKQVLQMKRLYATLSEVNQMIVRVKNREELYQSICDVCVTFGKFSVVWIGLMDETTGDIVPIAANGFDLKQWPFEYPNIHRGVLQNGVSVKAFLTSKVVTSEDIQTDERSKGVQHQLRTLDYHSLASLPIKFGGKTIGIVNLISSEIGLFNAQDEVGLLEEMSIDISFALDTMERERIRQQWADAFEHCGHGIAIGLPSGKLLTCNPAFARDHGTTVAEISSMPILDMYEPQYHEHMKQLIAQSDNTGSVQFIANKIRKDKSIFTAQMDLVSVRDESGKVKYRVATQLDITQRKNAEDALQNSESKFRSYIEHAPLGVMITDRNGIYKEVNPAAAQMFGYGMTELIGKSLTDLLSPQSLETGLQNFERLIVENISFDEYQMVRKDGKAIWVFVDAVKLNENSFLGFCQDTTIRKHFESELQKLSIAVEQSPVTIMITDTEGIIEYVNPVFTDISGFAYSEVFGKSVNILSTSTTPQETYTDMWRTIKEGKTWKGEFDNKKKNGELFTERATISPIKNDHGIITHFIAVKEDITGIQKSKKRIAEQSLMMKQLFDGSPTATVLMDAAKKVINANDAFVSLFGYSRNELYGKDVNTLIIPESKFEESEYLDNELALNHDVHLIESIRKNKAGIEIEVLISGLPVIIDGSIVSYYFMYLDISQQKMLQKQLIQAQKMEGIGTLAAGIAHDFNNILGIMTGYTSFLTTQRNNPEKFEHSIESMLKAGDRGASLVRQLLTFARKTTVKITSININETINELMKLLNETFPKNITITTSLLNDLPTINADASQIHQVILNLCVNARDAMPKGGKVTITTELIESDSFDRPMPKIISTSYVKLCIQDTGTGIPEEIRERIFEPFFTTKEFGKGTGLGLSVVFGIIERHNGTIFVDSDLEKGTIFTIFLPVPESAVTKKNHAKEIHVENTGGSETILLIEDEAMLKELMVSFMESKGYRVLSANDGSEGYDLFKVNQNFISAVFTDYGLPGIDGLELAKNILSLRPSMKIALASGYLDPSVHQEIEQIQNIQFIGKPYETADVMKIIRTMIDEQKKLIS